MRASRGFNSPLSWLLRFSLFVACTDNVQCLLSINSTACEYHCSLWTTSKVGGFTPAAAFAQWYTHGAQALPR